MNIFSILLLLTSFFITILAGYSFRFRRTTSGKYFFFLLFSVALFSFCYAFEINSVKLYYKLFWLKAGYIGLASISPLFFLFVLAFTGKERYITSWLVGIIVAIISFTLVANYTNDMHHLFYTNIWKKDVNMFSVLVLSRGPLYWPFIAYATICNALSIIFLFDIIIKRRGSFRTQSFLILLSTLPPWIINTLYILRESPYGIDFSAFGFMFTAIFLSFALFNYHLLGFIPIALENVFRSMHDGVILLDAKDRVMNYNAAASGLFKPLDSDVIGVDVKKLLEDHQSLVFQIKNKENDLIQFTIDLDSNIRYIQARILPITDKREINIGQAVMLYDITDETISREKLRISNETKDKLFSVVSHDLRGPLGNMMNLLTIICEQFDSMEKEDLKEILKVLETQTQSTYRLIENLLYWSRSQLGQIVRTLELLPLRSVINEVVEILNPSVVAKNISIRTQVEDDCLVYADLEMLKIVIRNLVGNSLKYCNPGGEIIVSAINKGDIVDILVEDNGIGMSEETLESLFKWTTERSTPGTNREPGSRLGLILCKEFIEKQNGTIRAESIKGEWSRFTVTLPSSARLQIS